jgi:hypothetical protein
MQRHQHRYQTPCSASYAERLGSRCHFRRGHRVQWTFSAASRYCYSIREDSGSVGANA